MQKMKKILARIMIVMTLSFAIAPSVELTTQTPITITAKAAYSKSTIKEVQKKLNTLGYDCGTADGIAGSKTKKAIKKYQEDQGFKITGSVNKTLLTSLGISTTSTASSTSKSSSNKSTSSTSTSKTNSNENKTVTVYITNTGSKYHRSGCRYLRKSKIAINLSDAKISYEACSVCNP